MLVALRLATPSVFRRVPTLAALLVLALAMLAPAAAQAERIGVNGQQIVTDMEVNPTRSALMIDTADRLGTSEMRLPIGWGWVEREPPSNGQHSYAWDSYDGVVLQMARRGIRVLADIDGAPKFEVPSRCWRGGMGVGMPAHPEWYGAFVQAFVARYGPGGTLWQENPDVTPRPVQRIELGNEQNHPYRWCTGAPNGAEYAQLVRSALDALGPDRQVSVITGGLYPLYAPRDDATVPDDEFLVQMRDADPTILDDVDEIGLHDYGSQAGALAGAWAFADAAMVELTLTRWKLLKAGIPPWKPVAITETGISGTPTLLSNGRVKTSADANDGTRGAALQQGVRRMLAADCGVSRVQVHTLATSMVVPSLYGYDGTTDPRYMLALSENFYGLARFDGSLRDAGVAWRTLEAGSLPAAGSSGECRDILRAFGNLDAPLKAAHPEWFLPDGRLRTVAP
ncbi:hypothetical protein [Patulibacter defluvii]|uniref:hypothetical protein n=1 Tax=Patulibacter defluvii TaxID=3095358 RepID=UPI002A754A61|nr:hypothetical protein [Patulibacter sp. DM4]